LAVLSVDIHAIKQDVMLYDQGESERPPGWKPRALAALRYKQAAFSAIKRHAETLQAARNEHRATSAADNVRADLERTIRARDKKIRALRHVQQRAELSLAQAKKWVKENYPDRIEDLYVTLSAVETAFDARHADEDTINGDSGHGAE
jgi:ribosomal protein L7/L12